MVAKHIKERAAARYLKTKERRAQQLQKKMEPETSRTHRIGTNANHSKLR